MYHYGIYFVIILSSINRIDRTTRVVRTEFNRLRDHAVGASRPYSDAVGRILHAVTPDKHNPILQHSWSTVNLKFSLTLMRIFLMLVGMIIWEIIYALQMLLVAIHWLTEENTPNRAVVDRLHTDCASYDPKSAVCDSGNQQCSKQTVEKLHPWCSTCQTRPNSPPRHSVARP